MRVRVLGARPEFAGGSRPASHEQPWSNSLPATSIVCGLGEKGVSMLKSAESVARAGLVVPFWFATGPK